MSGAGGRGVANDATVAVSDDRARNKAAGLNAAQKLDLFMLVAQRRAGRLRTEVD